jgi:hypothetical protein
MAKRRGKDADDDDSGDSHDSRPDCWNCGGKGVVAFTYDGQKESRDGGTGAGFDRCPTCKGTGKQ